MRVYKNYGDFRSTVDRLIEKYRGDMGCYVSITGYVRNYDTVDGKKIPSEGMVVDDISKKIEDIVENTLERFDIIDVVVYLNIGNLKVGDIITSIYVFARHRKEAFSACQYVIDEIKKYH